MSMLNVDAGNSPHRPENPPETRAAWRITWLAIIGLALFVLLFFAVVRFGGGTDGVDSGTQEELTTPGPGERQRPSPPEQPRS
jgi:hypothetical protein